MSHSKNLFPTFFFEVYHYPQLRHISVQFHSLIESDLLRIIYQTLVHIILAGVKRLTVNKKSRKAIDLTLLHKIIDFMDKSNISRSKFVIFGAIALLCYHGCFRIGELLKAGNSTEHAILVKNVSRIVDNGKCIAIRLHLHSAKCADYGIPDIEIQCRSNLNYCPVESLAVADCYRPNLRDDVSILENLPGFSI